MVRLLREAYHKKSISGRASGLSDWQLCVIQWGKALRDTAESRRR